VKGIPSPLPYLSKVSDERRDNSSYSWETMFLMTLLAIGCGSKNILAIAQWIQDHKSWLLRQGLKSKTGRSVVPGQASVYRFFWSLEENIETLEQGFSQWASAVVKTLKPGQRVSLNTDGKHLKGTKRQGKGEKAVLLVSAFLEELGLTLCQTRAKGDEAASAKQLIAQFNDLLPGVEWCLTGDAALTERPLVQRVLEQKGAITSPSKTIKANFKN
jgi:hypothetical protein